MRIVHYKEISHRLLTHFFSSAISPAALVRRFSAVQVDAVSIVSTNQSLVFASRLSNSTIPDLTNLYRLCDIIEVYAKERCIIMREDAPLFWPLLKARRKRHALIFKEYKTEIRRALEFATKTGCIAAGAIASTKTETVGGWGPKLLGTRVINLLWETGALVVKSRTGSRSTYALAPEGLWSSSTQAGEEEIRLTRWRRYLEGVGITDSRDAFAGFERCSAVERRLMLTTLLQSGAAVRVNGLNENVLCIVSSRLLESSEGRLDTLPTFIPPLDNFLWHRELVADLWGLDYRWEIYTPPAKRKYGPYAMPLITATGVYGPVDFQLSRADQILYGNFSKSPLRTALPNVKAAAEAAAFKLANAVGVGNVRLL